jgi:ParB/RepB/Spo0J family partition protein
MPSVLQGKDIVQVPVEKLEPNDWNPNKMTEGGFNELVDEIRDDDFDDPLKVVPHPDPAKADDGYFRIIDGEHRWHAAKVLGLPTLPCVVKDQWEDEHTQQLKTVRRNLLRGELDRTRFTKLVHRMNERGIPLKDMPRLFGFQSEQAFREKFIAEAAEREEGQKAAASKAAKKE